MPLIINADDMFTFVFYPIRIHALAGNETVEAREEPCNTRAILHVTRLLTSKVNYTRAHFTCVQLVMHPMHHVVTGNSRVLLQIY